MCDTPRRMPTTKYDEPRRVPTSEEEAIRAALRAYNHVKQRNRLAPAFVPTRPEESDDKGDKGDGDDEGDEGDEGEEEHEEDEGEDEEDGAYAIQMGEWNCELCTYRNASNRRVCRACKQMKWGIGEQLERTVVKEEVKVKEEAGAEEEIEVEEEGEDGDNGEYEVAKILEQKESEGETLYLVRWTGFTAEHDTWEPYSSLTRCEGALGEFRTRQKRQLEQRADLSTQAQGARRKRRRSATDHLDQCVQTAIRLAEHVRATEPEDLYVNYTQDKIDRWVAGFRKACSELRKARDRAR